MKITIVFGAFWRVPPAGFGAVEKVWMELAGLFARDGHKITVVGTGNQGRRRYHGPGGMEIVEIPGLIASGRIILDILQELWYSLRVIGHIPKSDIVVTNSFWVPVLLTPLKRQKGRIVVHVARFPKHQMWLYRYTDAVQAISGVVARAVTAQCPALRGRISVIGYPVDLALFKPRDRGPAASAGSPLILYVGRLHPEKGVHLLLQAFRCVAQDFPRACLKLVGPLRAAQGGGGEAYERSLREAATGLNVEFAGAIADRHALAEAYREADCFCYPSLAETGEAFGLAVLEAMASGLPCIVSGLECFADFLTHGEEGLVFDHRSAGAMEALADALRVILRDRQTGMALGARARAAAERYASRHIAGQYLALFGQVAAAGAIAN